MNGAGDSATLATLSTRRAAVGAAQMDIPHIPVVLISYTNATELLADWGHAS
jgi:hypothetical protein